MLPAYIIHEIHKQNQKRQKRDRDDMFANLPENPRADYPTNPVPCDDNQRPEHGVAIIDYFE